MVIVNPYAKKKKPAPSLSVGAGGGKHISCNRSDINGRFDSITRRPMASSGSIPASTKGVAQSHPSRVTPNGKSTMITNASRKNVASKLHVSPPSSIQQRREISSISSPNVPTAAITRSLHGKPSIVKRSSKSKLSVKQRLKQEITALKKQKQLQKLQIEAEERRRRRMAEKKAEEDRRMDFLAAKEEERRQKQVERERLAAVKQEEKIQKQRERERKQREKEQERERKREEKVRREQEKKVLLQQKIEEQKQKAEEKYQRDLQAWKKHQQSWIEQQQRINLIQQSHQRQQPQFNYHISGQQQMHVVRQNHQYQQQQLQNLSPRTPLKLPPKQANVQELNRKHVFCNAGVTPETTCQKTPSPPSSPLDSSTTHAIDTLMNSELFSSPQRETTDGNEASEMPSILVETAPSRTASADGGNKDFDLCIYNKRLAVSVVDNNPPRALQSEDSISCDINCALASLDKKDQPLPNGNLLASNDIQNLHTESKKKGFDHPEPFPATISNQVVPRTSNTTYINLKSLPQLPDKHESSQPALVPQSPTILSQNKGSRQHAQRMVPPSINSQYSLQSSMGYGSMFPNHRMPTQVVATTSYSSPMINSAVFNSGNFAMPGYYSTWVPPPPPPPLPPMFWQPKISRRVASVSKHPTAPKPSAPSLLCNPMETPSPFASQGRYLVTVMVIRDPRTETSFGVNLQLHTESALVDPQWLEAQQMKEGLKSKADKKYDSSTKAEAKQPSTSDGTNVAAPLGENPSPMPSSALVASQRAVTTNDKLPISASEERSSIHFSDHFDIKGRLEGAEQESVDSTRKVSPTTSTKNLSSASMNNVIKNPRTNDSIKYNSNNNIKEIVKDCLEHLVSSVVTIHNAADKTASSNATPVPIVQRRQRRRRVNFSVMQIMDTDKQNSRRPDIDPEKKLKSGDIVVAVQGHELNGMAFKDACGVFSKKAENVSDSLIQTQVIVARKRTIVAAVKVTNAESTNPIPLTSVVAPSPSKTPAIAPQLPENTSMVFSPSEIATMSNSFFQTLHSSSRVLGLDIQDIAWHVQTVIFRMGSLLKDTELTPRASITLKNKWSDLTRFLDYNLVEKGKTFWTHKFRGEFGDEKIPFSSDVERHVIRHLPRPSKGCRCKQKDHEHLFDPKCVLYRDLQRRLSKEELAKLRQQKKKNRSMSNKDLNVVESAFKNRMLKLKTATENESIEARFVEKMEEIQVKELHQAIFAPNLTTIVLSAIFELQREFYVSIDDDNENMNDDAEDDDAEDDDDDDVPLECLGKRKPEDQTEDDTKKQHKIGREGDPNFSIQYLIRMLEYVSKTWGHCYREPARDEYAWRWELFHAVHSDFDQWDAHATNPRESGSFPFENVRFGLSASKSIRDEVSSLPKTIRQFEDSIISNSYSPFEFSNEVLDQFYLVIHLLSPARSGLYDEMIALLKMGIFKISPSGIPVLTKDWWTKIDIVVLDEMNSSWSTKTDPDSRHCVSEELRDMLEEKWVKSDYGWSLLENRKELIFDFAILDEWRETFEGRLEEKANLSEGIGRFGL
jgi:hypothetical protein